MTIFGIIKIISRKHVSAYLRFAVGLGVQNNGYTSIERWGCKWALVLK